MVKRQVFLKDSIDKELRKIAIAENIGVSTLIRDIVEKALFLKEYQPYSFLEKKKTYFNK